MIKELIKQTTGKFGYGIVKTSDFNFGKRNARKSKIENLDYYETSIGNYYLPKNTKTDVVANAMREGTVFDKPIIELASSIIKKGTSVLDIGANYGQMSIIFSKLLDNTGIVYSFEAQEMIHKILVKNLEINNCQNVNVFCNAVYDQNNTDLVFPEPDLVRFSCYGSYGIDPNGKQGRKVKSI